MLGLERPSLSHPERRSLRVTKKILFWSALASIFFAWQILYLPHLRDSPPWYGDETGTLLIGRELVQGEAAIGAISLTFWHVYFPYQPIYAWLAGLFALATGGDILGARFLNALIALLIAVLLCFWGRSRLGAIPAWFGALIFLCYSQSIIHFRWIYPHNLVALGFTVCLLYLLRSSRPAHDWRAGVGLAIAAAAHPLFSHGALAALLCRIKKPQAWLRLAAPPAMVITAIFLYVSWKYWPKPWLFEDLPQLSEFYGRSGSAAADVTSLLTNITRFYSHDFFHQSVIVCFFLCCRRRFYPISIWIAAVSALLLVNRQNLPIFYYQAIILVPIFALAWAGALSVVGGILRRWRLTRRWHRVFLGGAFLVPMVMTALQLPAVIQGRLIPRNQLWVTQSIPEVEHAASWLNERTSPSDLVIANSNIAWLLKGRTADFLQATLWQGYPTVYFAKAIRRERFRYSANLDTAKYVVVGDIDQVWTLGQPNVNGLVRKIRDEKWPIVWSGKYYVILANPNFQR